MQMTLNVGLRRLLSMARRSHPGDLLPETRGLLPPGGDSVPLHRHPADLPLQQLAG